MHSDKTYDELCEMRLGDMSKDELFDFACGLLDEFYEMEDVVREVSKQRDDLFNHLTKKDLDYKSRINKAIKYINKHSCTNPYLSKLLVGSEIEDILDILRGKDE